MVFGPCHLGFNLNWEARDEMLQIVFLSPLAVWMPLSLLLMGSSPSPQLWGSSVTGISGYRWSSLGRGGKLSPSFRVVEENCCSFWSLGAGWFGVPQQELRQAGLGQWSWCLCPSYNLQIGKSPCFAKRSNREVRLVAALLFWGARWGKHWQCYLEEDFLYHILWSYGNFFINWRQ